MQQQAAVGAPGRGVGAAIFLLSLAILVLQIALTRLLSVVLWYHFAFVAISLAMLGLALAGVLLYLRPALLAATPRLLPWYCRAGGVTAVLALAYVLAFARSPSGGNVLTGEIALLYVVLLVPFACAGLAVSALLAYHVRHIGPLYARDLAGAGLGCVLAVPLLDLGGAPAAILAGAAIVLSAGLVLAPRRHRAADAALLLAALGLLGWHAATGLFEPRAMHGIPDEDAAAGTVREFAGWNSHSRVVVTATSELAKSINIDGHATTGVYRLDRPATTEYVRERLPWMALRAGSMPYVALGAEPGHPADVFLIGPGGGLDLLNGIWFGARITGVELNGLIHGLMQDGPLAQWAGDVYRAPGVAVHHDEARSWLRRSEARFDLIQASMIDTWAATAGGAFALAENALYTVEAFLDYRDHLTERGLVHFLRWHEDPPRQSLRLLALAAEASRRAGCADPARHLVALEEPQFPDPGVPMVSVLWSREPFTADALARLRAAVAERAKIAPVRILCWPGERADNPLSRFLHAPDPGAFVAAYPFDVSASTDDRPFFFHTRRAGDLLAASGGGLENEEAVHVLGAVLLTVLVLCLLAFLAPLAWALRLAAATGGAAGDDARGAVPRLAWFCCIGVGFMLLEVPFLQRFGLYVGHPAWTLSTVLAALLLGAGLGGMGTARVADERLAAALRRALAAILAVGGAATLLSPWLADATLRWPFGLRVLVTAAVMAPLGYVLGRALPLGMRALHAVAPSLVPWAWGLNGAASVLASVLAVALAMQLGFTAALASGLACYALGLALVGPLARRSALPSLSREPSRR